MLGGMGEAAPLRDGLVPLASGQRTVAGMGGLVCDATFSVVSVSVNTRSALALYRAAKIHDALNSERADQDGHDRGADPGSNSHAQNENR